MKKYIYALAVIGSALTLLLPQSARHGGVEKGTFDASGTSSFIVRFGTSAPVSADCDAAAERGGIYVRTGDPSSVPSRVSVCLQTGTSTYGWFPASHKTGTAASGSCDVGELFFDTDATAGRNLFACTSAGVWTELAAISAGTGISITGAGSISTDADRASVDNDVTTGTVVNLLVKLTGAPSTAIRAATSDTGGVIGICEAGCGTSGAATIKTQGLASCAFDASTTAGNYIQIDGSTAGNCNDAGSSLPIGGGQILGRVLVTGTGAATRQVFLFGPGIHPAGGTLKTTRMYSQQFFRTGALIDTLYGSYNWPLDTIQGCAANTQLDPAGWGTNGALGVTTNATTNHDCGYRPNASTMPHVAGLNAVPAGGAFRYKVVVTTSSNVSDLRAIARFVDAGATRQNIAAADSVGFTVDTGVDNSWRVQFCASSTCTATDTGVDLATNTTYTLWLESTIAGTWTWEVYTGPTLSASNTAAFTTPSAAMFPHVMLVTLAAAAKTMTFIRLEYEMVGM